MASSQPIIRQVKVLALIPQFIILGFFIFVFSSIGVSDPLIWGLVVYLLLSIIVRQLIPRNHRKGIRLFKQRNYEKAIVEFQRSYDFFKKNSWIDKYRSIVLLSSSRASYLEMALINIAFCYSQIGEGSKAKEFYEKTLELFPESQMAISALKLINSAQNIK